MNARLTHLEVYRHVLLEAAQFKALPAEVRAQSLGLTGIWQRYQRLEGLSGQWQKGNAWMPGRQPEKPAAGAHGNGHITARQVREICALDDATKRLLEQAINRPGISARAYDRVLKVLRITANLPAKPRITKPHIAEAIQYRSLDRICDGKCGRP